MNFWFRFFFSLLLLSCVVVTVTLPQVKSPFPGQTQIPDSRLKQRTSARQPGAQSDTTRSFYKRKAEWNRIIDEYWGPGEPYSQKLNIFNTYSSYVRAKFPAFVYSKLNWDSVTAFWRMKVTDSTSRGAFSAILGKLANSLNEWHAFAYSDSVEATPLQQGTPLAPFPFFTRDVRHFGAALTPLPDKSLLVYKVIGNHPLGLQPGDRVLGYEGVLWSQLFDTLSQAGVGTGFNIGSCPTAHEYFRSTYAGMFWHLFDTIDVVKYSTGQTVHLPTAPLASIDQSAPLLHCDQLPIEGVPMPSEELLTDDVTYGIVRGTNIGYIYVRHHVDTKIPLQFDGALRALANAAGLIIDLRLDFGGFWNCGLEKGIARLVSFGDETLKFWKRSSASDLQAMAPTTLWVDGTTFWDLSIPADDGTMYDRPVAVLVGPQCTSYGDITAKQLSYVPGVRFFGKSPAGAYSGYWDGFGPSVSGYTLWSPDFIEVDHRFPSVAIWNKEFPVDEEVWLTPDGVAKGEDDVVKRALEWISTLSYAHDLAPSTRYVPPTANTVGVHATVENPGKHSLVVSAILCDSTGIQADSIVLANDGLHDDGAAGDSIWGGSLKLPVGEQTCGISVRTDDLTQGTFRRLPNATFVTSAGPIVLDGYMVTASDTAAHPGNILGYRLMLRNNGISTTVPNVIASVRSSDTTVTLGHNYTLSFGKIAPGQVASSSALQYVQYSASRPGTYSVQFVVDISSNGRVFWSDTFSDVVTGVGPSMVDIPSVFALGQNYPNPFNPNTTIKFELPRSAEVKLSVYDILGREVAVLVNERKALGSYEVHFDGSGLASGVYVYRLTAGREVLSRKMILAR